MDSDKIGNLIKDIRKKNNLTQKEFADKYNVTYQAVSKWENGKNLPDITLLRDICNDYNINFSEVLDNKQNRKINKFIFILIAFIIITIILIILFNKKDNTFQFKTISTSCKDFEVSGSIAYDSKRSFIYISNITYCGENDNNTYQKIEYLLYSKENDTKTEIYKDEINSNDKLENYLKQVKMKVDSYEKSCKVYKDNHLFLEIKAYKEDNTMKLFEIPLSLDKSCHD